ncbi:hypothetical protein AS850_01450 [Frondihabitans sp. 762G35]|uniref:CBU_0592 family membrane protein n=1 Tax=Frondihabitans sp. 762G35 TaxID=1446794 RepID=UPI000D20869C|nr:hypothetical protein [Frondihabitans sp. 762G35]ARC55741.1 hypothetical protein AS850_01450 [Frondihabitans sp. 762G35]
MFIEILGWFGALVILAGYALFSLGRLPDGRLYQWTNLVGAVCISINVAVHGAYPSAIVNAIWAIIAAVVLLRLRSRRRAERLAASHAAAQSERRIRDAEMAQLAPAPFIESVPAVTAALAVVVLAAAHHEQAPQFAPGAPAAV